MDDFLFLVPIALGLGLMGLAAFMWTLRDGQYDDLRGAAERILLDEDDRPLPTPTHTGNPPRRPWTP
jgi:cbb3-type cytochrome oxidase maturation protein